MEKDQKPLVSWMMNMSYRPVIFKTVANLILLRIGEMIDAVMRATYIPEDKKPLFIKDLLERESIKSQFMNTLKTIEKNEIDVIAEIMKQYSIDKHNSDATEYHDEMVVMFREECQKIRGIIAKNQYKRLYVEAKNE